LFPTLFFNQSGCIFLKWYSEKISFNISPKHFSLFLLEQEQPKQPRIKPSIVVVVTISKHIKHFKFNLVFAPFSLVFSIYSSSESNNSVFLQISKTSGYLS